MSLETWNRRYAAGEKLDQAPASLVERFASALPPGAALDLACGPGRNAIYLAALGWRVTAVDGSDIALEHLRKRAEENRLALDIRRADLERGEFPIPADSFDLVLDILYLERSLVPGIQRGLRPGGLVIATALLQTSEKRSATRVVPGELRTLYQDWNVLYYRENQDSAVAELVGSKPNP